MSSGKENRVFELIAGHPALDLVNTLDWRFRASGSEELLENYDDLLSFASQAELLSPKLVRKIARKVSTTAAEAALTTCRELREAAAEILYDLVEERAPQATAMKSVEALIANARQHQHLRFSAPRLHWSFPDSKRQADLPVWLLSLRVADLLVSEKMERVRACENDECRWLFLDTSKNHTRRWCDMKVCGNRMKARRYKAQHQI